MRLVGNPLSQEDPNKENREIEGERERERSLRPVSQSSATGGWLWPVRREAVEDRVRSCPCRSKVRTWEINKRAPNIGISYSAYSPFVRQIHGESFIYDSLVSRRVAFFPPQCIFSLPYRTIEIRRSASSIMENFQLHFFKSQCVTDFFSRPCLLLIRKGNLRVSRWNWVDGMEFDGGLENLMKCRIFGRGKVLISAFCFGEVNVWGSVLGCKLVEIGENGCWKFFNLCIVFSLFVSQ